MDIIINGRVFEISSWKESDYQKVYLCCMDNSCNCTSEQLEERDDTYRITIAGRFLIRNGIDKFDEPSILVYDLVKQRDVSVDLYDRTIKFDGNKLTIDYLIKHPVPFV